VQVSQNGVAQLSYTYDALGRRTSKTVQGGTPMQYLYDVNNIVQEAQGSTINPILVGLSIDERFARNDVTGRTYFLSDLLNSAIALTDPTGTLKEQYSYDPYGNVTLSDTTTGFTNPYQYTGREADSPGLYYYRARYYSPMMTGFISEDSAELLGGQLTFYGYAGGDPLNFNDPTGQFLPLITGAIGAIAAGGGDTIAQLFFNHCKPFNWKELGIATAGGFVGGFALPFVAAAGGGVAGAMLTGGLANLGVYAATTEANGGSLDAGDALWAYGSGLVGGAIAGAVRIPTPWGYAGTAASAEMVNASNDAAATRANTGLGSLVRGFGGGVASSTPNPADGSGADCGCSK
jgi:RHS repeat-associated protein